MSACMTKLLTTRRAPWVTSLVTQGAPLRYLVMNIVQLDEHSIPPFAEPKSQVSGAWTTLSPQRGPNLQSPPHLPYEPSFTPSSTPCWWASGW